MMGDTASVASAKVARAAPKSTNVRERRKTQILAFFAGCAKGRKIFQGSGLVLQKRKIAKRRTFCAGGAERQFCAHLSRKKAFVLGGDNLRNAKCALRKSAFRKCAPAPNCHVPHIFHEVDVPSLVICLGLNTVNNTAVHFNKPLQQY